MWENKKGAWQFEKHALGKKLFVCRGGSIETIVHLTTIQRTRHHITINAEE
jgi:hypothetical protein